MLQNIYSCFCRNTQRFVNEQPTNKTPLLSRDQGGVTKGDAVINQPAHVTVSGGGFYPVEKPPDVRAKVSGKPRKITVGFTNVKSVDKRLQDASKLYNEYYQKYDDLQSHHNDLSSAFPEQNPEKSLDVTFKLLRKKTSECLSVSINRKSNHGYTRVEFDPRELPSDALCYLTKFNAAKKLIKELSDRGAKLSDTVLLVLKDETEHRRDVLAASMGVEGPECMKMCIGGINELRKVPGFIEEILRRTKKINKRGQRAVQYLTQDDDDTAQMSDVIVRVHRSDTSSSGSGEDKLVAIEGKVDQTKSKEQHSPVSEHIVKGNETKKPEETVEDLDDRTNECENCTQNRND